MMIILSKANKRRELEIFYCSHKGQWHIDMENEINTLDKISFCLNIKLLHWILEL